MIKNKVQKNTIPDGWNNLELGIVIDISNEKVNPKKTEIKLPCLELENIEQDKGLINGVQDANKKSSVKNIFNKGDVLYGKLRPYLRKYYYANFDGVCSTEIWVLKNKKKILKKFLYVLVQSDRFNYYTNKTTGSKMPRADWSLLKNITFTIPPLSEQKRIVGVLEVWDLAVEKLERKIVVKENIKTGLMQQLLTGKKRLPGFSGTWEEKKLGELVICLDNQRVPLNQGERQKCQGTIPYCGANGVVDYIDDYIFNEEIILIAEDGGQFDEYKTRPIAYKMSGKIWVNNHAHIIKSNEYSNQDYIYYATVHKNILKYLNGGTRAKLNKSEMLKIKYLVPKEIREQKAIAEVLTTADEEIMLLRKKLDKLKDQKKYLLNNLVTGTIRI